MGNRLLNRLPKNEYKSLIGSAKAVSLEHGDEVYQEDSLGGLSHVYFPTSGMISLTVLMEDGKQVEAGTIGNEGMVGLSVALGLDFSPTQVKKWIGAYAAALGGLDTLVFAGGIGENAPTVRARICAGLGFLGIELEEKRNATNEGVISAATGRVAVRVIHTDEEWMIANMVCCVLGLTIRKEHGHAT